MEGSLNLIIHDVHNTARAITLVIARWEAVGLKMQSLSIEMVEDRLKTTLIIALTRFKIAWDSTDNYDFYAIDIFCNGDPIYLLILKQKHSLWDKMGVHQTYLDMNICIRDVVLNNLILSLCVVWIDTGWPYAQNVPVLCHTAYIWKLVCILWTVITSCHYNTWIPSYTLPFCAAIFHGLINNPVDTSI